jgi:hypothetical protein
LSTDEKHAEPVHGSGGLAADHINVRHTNMDRDPNGWIAYLCLSLLAAFVCIFSFKTGAIGGRGTTLKKEDSPVIYYSVILGEACLAAWFMFKAYSLHSGH